MGWASELWIETHNERLATDERYAADYEERMRIDAALEAEFFAREREDEKLEDWFDDLKIDHTGYTEIIEPENAKFLIDDEDLPF